MLLLLVACQDTKDDTALVCPADEGLVTGSVTVNGEADPEATAWVEGTAGEYVELTLSDSGTFAVCLAEGAWNFWGAAHGCDEADPVDVEAGGTYTADVVLQGVCETGGG